MRFVDIKKDIYLTFVLLGVIMLVVAVNLARTGFETDIVKTMLFLVSMIQGSICLGFGAFTWIFEEDPEVWQ
ncbi:MAG: hypothetical protein IT343_12280 [Candidatus Melainabacteria bacterium]|jgi:hypothetical protein|nr:hypothetical protein [Candidatus Melainabacteria bacterium]